MKRLLTLAYLLQAGLSGDSDDSTVANSCIGKEDGTYWIQFAVSDESYVPLYLECSNEYVILDYSKDPNLEYYFSSFEKWHYGIGGPANANPVTWEQWFLPNEKDANVDASYLIAPDCDVCDETADRQAFETKSAYWMSGNLAKLTWSYVGFNDCDMDKDTYSCYDCTSCRDNDSPVCYPTLMEETETDWTKTGICGVAVQESNREIQYTRTLGMLHRTKPHFKPSLGTDGRHCVCYKPDSRVTTNFALSDENMQMIAQRMDDIEEAKAAAEAAAAASEFEAEGEDSENDNDNDDADSDEDNGVTHKRVDGHEIEEEDEDLRETNVMYLSQNDFSEGTFRITKSGTYIITEDIEFDFNKDDDYWPRADQADDYPGAASYRDPYFMGFFAGITVEADYVTIDLNGHELKQSTTFHYQQRWFAIIELGSQQFLPGI